MGNKKWIFFIVGGIFIVFIICIFLIPNTIRMRSNVNAPYPVPFLSFEKLR